MSEKKIIDEGQRLAQVEHCMVWKPLYPNNMICNGVDGYYCLMIYKHKDGSVAARKYTIKFQYQEIKPATGHIDPNKITHYILFEKSYQSVVGPLEYPEPTNGCVGFLFNSENTFSAYDVNNYGNFIYAYDDLETAKQRACTQYEHIYGYVMSFLAE